MLATKLRSVYFFRTRPVEPVVHYNVRVVMYTILLLGVLLHFYDLAVIVSSRLITIHAGIIKSAGYDYDFYFFKHYTCTIIHIILYIYRDFGRKLERDI